MTLVPWADQIEEELRRLERRASAEGTTGGIELYPWQVEPEGDWYGWAMTGGRGIGKTARGASWSNEQAESFPGSRGAIIAPTLGDARATCVFGETGIQSINPDIYFHREDGEVRWPNRSTARIFGAYTPEDRERLRGPQYEWAWLEEFAAWRQLDEHPREGNPDVWQHITFGLRLGDDSGPRRPRFMMTTTPKRRARFKQVLARPDVVVTRGSTYQATGLPSQILAKYEEEYGGTRLGQQELLGEMLEDVEGALWSETVLNEHRVDTAPPLAQITVGVDPAGSSVTGVVGIVAVGVSFERFPHPRTSRPIRHGYVLEDASLSGPPEVWGQAAIDLYHALEADHLVAERNYGGEMVESTLRTVDPTVPVRMVNSSRGKRLRAEPIAALGSQGILHPVGKLPLLEGELTSWTEDSPWSPNRLDAMVFAGTDLLPHMRARSSLHGVSTPTGSLRAAPASRSAVAQVRIPR